MPPTCFCVSRCLTTYMVVPQDIYTDFFLKLMGSGDPSAFHVGLWPTYILIIGCYPTYVLITGWEDEISFELFAIANSGQLSNIMVISAKSKQKSEKFYDMRIVVQSLHMNYPINILHVTHTRINPWWLHIGHRKREWVKLPGCMYQAKLRLVDRRHP